MHVADDAVPTTLLERAQAGGGIAEIRYPVYKALVDAVERGGYVDGLDETEDALFRDLRLWQALGHTHFLDGTKFGPAHLRGGDHTITTAAATPHEGGRTEDRKQERFEKSHADYTSGLRMRS